MNTVKSFWIGWGSLVVGGAGAYFFAKREIDADRRKKHLEIQRKQWEQRRMQEALNEDAPQLSPAEAASEDPAPTRHVPMTEEQKVHEKSKYEATASWRSPKGDRFS